MSLYFDASKRNHGTKQRKATGDKSYENFAKSKYLEMKILQKKLMQARRNHKGTDFGGMSDIVTSFPGVCFLKTQCIN